LALLRKAPAKAAFLLVLILLLTAITQIGGLVLWLCTPGFGWVERRFSRRHPLVRTFLSFGLFAAAYLAFSLAVVPLAGLSGRVPLPCGWIGAADIAPATRLTCLANRHFVSLPTQQALHTINARFSAGNSGYRIIYLDAGFPLFDGFPMIPHLSHGDGRKIDLALIYNNRTTSPSPVGYWAYIQPRPTDSQPCAGGSGWLRWDLEWLQPMFGKPVLDEDKTRSLLITLANAPEVRRIFIEPHLKQRMGLTSTKIRFQGCRAARHDDHIHVEF
jgi:hypothetical protein